MLLSLLLLFHLLGFILALDALMTARTSQGATAWVISLITLPYVAIPLYWFFGRSKFEGYTSARKEAEEVVANKLKNRLTKIEKYVPQDSSLGSFEKSLQHLAKMPYFQANELELLIDGEKTFASILEGIAKAKEYVLLEFYIVRDDTLGRKVQQSLIKKAQEGVKIYFIYDEIGSHQLPESYLNTMREAKIEVYNFHTQKGIKNRFQINFRNHRKIVIVDGITSWLGGLNIGDEYLSQKKKFGHWRDTHLKITGPSTIAVQKTFIEDWYWATEKHIENLRWTPLLSQKENKKVLIVPSSPSDIVETASLMYLQAINAATERIWISSPYFIPDRAIIKALQLAGLRGVDVRILIPAKADHILVYLAAFTYFENIAVTGVKFFRYNDGFLHQKVMLIDSLHATVGTVNMDNRSFRLNFEIAALISDEAFAQEIKMMFEEDFKNSYEINMQQIHNEPFLFKLITRLARLTSPVL